MVLVVLMGKRIKLRDKLILKFNSAGFKNVVEYTTKRRGLIELHGWDYRFTNKKGLDTLEQKGVLVTRYKLGDHEYAVPHVIGSKLNILTLSSEKEFDNAVKVYGDKQVLGVYLDSGKEHLSRLIDLRNKRARVNKVEINEVAIDGDSSIEDIFNEVIKTLKGGIIR